MAGKILALARATCSAKYMIRANWSQIGGHRSEPVADEDPDIPGGKRPHTGGSALRFIDLSAILFTQG